MADALADFDQLWAVMTPENRCRLVCALVHEVTVEPGGAIAIAIGPLVAGEAAA